MKAFICKCGNKMFYGAYCVDCYHEILKTNNGYYNDLYKEELKIQLEIIKTKNLRYKPCNRWKKYKAKVWKLTEENYKRHPMVNSERRGFKDHHLDHIVSIRYCFKHDIPEEVTASPENLRMIPYKENMIKGIRVLPDLNNLILRNS